MIVKACLSLLAGIYALQLSSLPFGFDSIPVVFVAAAVLLFPRRSRWPGIALAGMALFAAAARDVADSRLDPLFAGDSLVSRVIITSFPRHSGPGVSFHATPVDDPRLPGRLRLSWFEPPVALRPGDTWAFELRLRRPRSASNPGGRDIEAWLTRERIGAIGYVVPGPRNHLVASGPADALTGIRAGFDTRVHRVVRDEQRAAILSAVVTGARHGLSPEQWQQFALTGTSHLMAISGLHVGLAAGASYGLVRGLSVAWAARGNVHRLAIAASMAVAVLYALVSGLAVPAQRASLMVLLAGMAWFMRRRPEPARIVAGAAAVLAIADPLVTMGAGFKLSFGAVAVLLWQAQRHERSRGPAVRMRQLGSSQLLLLCGLLPVVATEFGRVSLAAPVANLLAVPVFSFVTVPFALAGLVLAGPLAPAGDACLRLAALSLQILEPLLSMLASLPVLTPSVPVIEGPARLLLLGVWLWAVLPPGWPGRSLAWLALAATVTYRPASPAEGCVSFHVLDVGQGLAAVAETQNHVLVYDTGQAFRGGGDSALAVLLPFLEHRGIRRVDRLVVSHGDTDHAGGVRSLLDGIAVRSTWYGELPAYAAGLSSPCLAGRSWSWDGVDFRILHPPVNSSFAGNDRSCVLLIDVGGRRLLLPGDIERAGEAELLANRPPGKVAAVVVPHHGSRTSSSPEFVRELRPDIAIVAAGFRNRWDLPAPEVVRRWQGIGATVLNTAEEGAIGLELCEDADGVSARSGRHLRRRIWHE